MSTPSAALAFVGAGSLGQTYAALLARSGQAVTLLATPSTAARLLAAKQIRLVGVVDVSVPVAPAPAPPGSVGITDDPARLPPGVGLVFTTKGHHLPAAVASVRAAWPGADDAAAWVAGVQNGVAKDDVLTEAFGAARVVGAATILGAGRVETGEVRVTSLGMTYLGEFSGERSARVAAATAALAAAGIPAEEPGDIRGVLWSKACNAAGVFGVAVLAAPNGPWLFHNPDLMRAYLALVRETAAIARAEGVRVGNYPHFPPIRTYAEEPIGEIIAAMPPPPAPAEPATPAAPPSHPSMVQDFLAGRPMEVDEIFGDLVARAERGGIPAPTLAFVRDVLRGLNGASRAAGTR